MERLKNETTSQLKERRKDTKQYLKMKKRGMLFWNTYSRGQYIRSKKQ